MTSLNKNTTRVSKFQRIISQVMIFFALVSAFVIIFEKTSYGQTKKKKLYISSIKAKSVSRPMAKRVHDGLKLTIFEKYGVKYQILDDEAVKVIYKQAEKLLALGCDAQSCMKQIADGIEADEIIYGEVRREDKKIRLVLNNLVRNQKTFSLGTKSIVNISFNKNRLNHFVSEAAKKLINPRYKISRKYSEFDYKTLDISILRFTSPDKTMEVILAYLKNLVREGDEYYKSQEYTDAIRIYEKVINKVESKLSRKKRKKMTSFMDGILERLVVVYETMGDNSFREYRFKKTLVNYKAGKDEVQKISNRKERRTHKRRLSRKIKSTWKTGRNYVSNRIKSLLDQAEIMNLQDNIDRAERILERVRIFINENKQFVATHFWVDYNEIGRKVGVDILKTDKEIEEERRQKAIEKREKIAEIEKEIRFILSDVRSIIRSYNINEFIINEAKRKMAEVEKFIKKNREFVSYQAQRDYKRLLKDISEKEDEIEQRRIAEERRRKAEIKEQRRLEEERLDREEREKEEIEERINAPIRARRIRQAKIVGKYSLIGLGSLIVPLYWFHPKTWRELNKLSKRSTFGCIFAPSMAIVGEVFKYVMLREIFSPTDLRNESDVMVWVYLFGTFAIIGDVLTSISTYEDWIYDKNNSISKVSDKSNVAFGLAPRIYYEKIGLFQARSKYYKPEGIDLYITQRF